MEIPATIAIQSALERQNVALSLIKRNADQQQQIAKILEDSAQSTKVAATSGGHALDIRV